MNRPIVPLALLTCLALLTTSPRLLAQAASTAQPASPPAPATTAPVQPGPTFNLTFKGGSVADYIAAVRQASGGTANVLVMPDANRVDMPPVTLTGVNLHSAVYIVNNRTQLTTDRYVTLTVDNFARELGEASIYTIDAKVVPVPGRPNLAPPDTQVSQVWSLTDLIDGGIKAEDALSAIETALNLYPKNKVKPEIRFHKETGLLLARGEADQLAAIHEVLDSLSTSVQSKRDRKTEEARGVGVSALQSKIAALEKRVDALHNRLDGGSDKPK